MMISNIGFAIEMQVVANGEPFSINGDQERIVVNFPSISTARRVLPLLPHDLLKTVMPVEQFPIATVIETRVSGRTIALSGLQIKSNAIAGILGLPKTQIFFLNLLRSFFRST
jgi:hypothetical protein